MSRVASAASSPVPDWHRRFLAMLPRIVTHARIAFRHLNPEARAEAVQAVVCNAMQAFVRLVKRGKESVAYPLVLARYGVAQVKDGRMVGGHLNVQDVSSAYCHQRKGITLDRLDNQDEETGEWREILLEDRRSGPAEIAASRIDFAAWLRSLPAKLRRIAKFLATGETTTVAAKKFGLSPGRISQVRKELHLAWKKFVGEEPGAAAVPA